MQHYDLAIIGGGIIGAALAWRVSQCQPGLSVLLLEKEDKPACHQSGRNSGVIHAGVYYPPGSLKASLCRQGREAMVRFCQDHDIAFARPGKLIVATDSLEQSRLAKLFQRCQDNGLQPRWLDRYALGRAEPNVRGQAAIYVKETGIVDYAQVARRMMFEAQQRGVDTRFGCPVKTLRENDSGVHIGTSLGQFSASQMINCAGVMTDRLARLMDLEPDFQMVPFRGEYFCLPDRFNQICRHLIYPVPDPAMPFLGVHLTKMIDGSVTVGPNAVLALGREAYHKHHIAVSDCAEMARFTGLWRFIRQFWRPGLEEMVNSLWTRGYLQQVRKYCPQLRLQDLRPYPSGIRAQAVRRDGTLVQDFHFMQTERSLHVGNAPSPAATSSIPIAENLLQRLDLL